MSEKPTDEDVTEYLHILMDATKQRASQQEIEKCSAIATCIQEIYDSLKKYKINTTQDIVHTLVSVMVIPVMMLEPDPDLRAETLKELGLRFTKDIFYVLMKDQEIRNSETGKELDKLRNLVHDSEIFKK